MIVRLEVLRDASLALSMTSALHVVLASNAELYPEPCPEGSEGTARNLPDWGSSRGSA